MTRMFSGFSLSQMLSKEDKAAGGGLDSEYEGTRGGIYGKCQMVDDGFREASSAGRPNLGMVVLTIKCLVAALLDGLSQTTVRGCLA